MEVLSIDVGNLIMHEYQGGTAIRPTYNIFGENLARCIEQSGKLRRLKIINEAALRTDFPTTIYSSAFLAAMVPVIRAGLSTLKEIDILCGDYPLAQEDDYPTAGYDFFKAVLNLQNLTELTVKIRHNNRGQLLNDFLDASRDVHDEFGRLPSDTLEKVWLAGPEPEFEHLIQFSSLAQFLVLLERTTNLRELKLWMAEGCWNEESERLLLSVLNGNSSLDHVVVGFYGYCDTNGRILNYAWNCIQGGLQGGSCPSYLSLFDMGDVDENSEAHQALENDIFSPHDGYPVLRETGIGWNILFDRTPPSATPGA